VAALLAQSLIGHETHHPLSHQKNDGFRCALPILRWLSSASVLPPWHQTAAVAFGSNIGHTMASTYPAVTAYLPPSLTPAVLNDDEAENLLSDSQGADELPPIFACSRHGYIGGAVRNFSQALGLQHLAFLYGEPWNDPKGRSAYLLQGDELARIGQEISIFFSRAADSPDECSDWIDWDAESIVTVLESAKPSPAPTVDDGYNPDTLFAYLKALAQYCEFAMEHSGSLLHIQWDGG
jgi:hypothetical protein